MRVQVVDPSAYTPPYDHALSAALARAGADVELWTSRFTHGAISPADGYERRESFYRWLPPRGRAAAKLAQHAPGMLSLRRARADVTHFQWLAVQPADVHLLPRDRPVVLTAHDVLPREPRAGQVTAQRRLYDAVDAVIVHGEHGRRRLTGDLGVAEEKVHVIPHGALDHLTAPAREDPLPAAWAAVDQPVVLFFGLIRPYKGLADLLEAWRGIDGAELWVVGNPRMEVADLRANAPAGVRWRLGFVPDAELPALFRRADLVVLPYSEIEQSGVLYTALAFGRPLLLTDVGDFGEVASTGAAELVPARDPDALRTALVRLVADPGRREELAAASAQAAREVYGWDPIARRTLALYESLLQ